MVEDDEQTLDQEEAHGDIDHQAELNELEKEGRKRINNSFHANVLFLDPLETSENLFFLTVSGGIEIGHWREKG